MLVLALLTTTLQASVVTNGSFETPVFTTNSHNYVGLTGTDWTHTGRSGIHRGNTIFGSNNFPADGDQMAFLQGDVDYTNGVTSLGQTLNGLVVGQSYNLSFQALGLNGYNGANPFNVSIGGTDLFGLITPGINTYTQYVSDPFIATSASMDLLFHDQGNADKLTISFIDDVQVNEYVPNLVENGDFETPAYVGSHHNYDEDISTASGWTRTGRAGIDLNTNYSGGSTNSTPFEGAQMGFMQGDLNNPYSDPGEYDEGNSVTSLSRDVSGFVVGQDYILSFQAKGIDGTYAVNPISVSIDGADLFSLLTPTLEYQKYTSAQFTATAETMNLMFYDQPNNPGTQVTFIDDVRINAVPEPGTLSLLLVSAIAVLAVRTRRRK